jgi:hypothetical protein
LHYEWCYKKTKTHKTKSAEGILLQQYHRSKNIIQVSDTGSPEPLVDIVLLSLSTVEFVYSEVQGTLDLISL